MTTLDLAAISTRWADAMAADPTRSALHRLADLGRCVPDLLAEVERLHAILDEIRLLHTDSPAGVCPSCGRISDVSDDDDGLVGWPCPTLRAMGIEDWASRERRREEKPS